MRGRRKTACGQRRSASAALIAERMPKLPGGIVRGRDHAAPVRVAADDERPLAQRRILELLDRGEERVEVEVGENPHPRKATVRG